MVQNSIKRVHENPKIKEKNISPYNFTGENAINVITDLIKNTVLAALFKDDILHS